MSQFSLSLSKLIANLIKQPDKEEYISLPDEEIKPTTIRLDPAVRRFCNDQSEKLGLSIQAFISMTLKGVMLESTNPVQTTFQLMYDRFFELFSEHHIALSDIPSVLSQSNITRSMLADKNRVIDFLSDDFINTLKDKFNVSPSWLKGVKDASVSINHIEWYKNIDQYCSYIIKLKSEGLNPHLMFIKSAITDLSSTEHADHGNNEVMPIIRTERKYLDNHYYCYEVGTVGDWGYWRGRTHLKCIALFCKIFNISNDGYTLENKKFRQLACQERLASSFLPRFIGRTWSPDNYVCLHDNNGRECKSSKDMYEVYSEFYQHKLDKLLMNYNSDRFRYELDLISKKYNELQKNIDINIESTIKAFNEKIS